jgi:uncharacterized protein YidB (DUF937 family)
MDLSQIMKLANDPTVRSLLQSVLGKFMGGGGAPDVNRLVSTMESNGLGDQVQSWVGTGSNQPVSPEQVQQALGTDTIDQAAAAAGTSPDEAAKMLANVLPQLVDKVSPDGQMPNPATLQDSLGPLMQPKQGSAQ